MESLPFDDFFEDCFPMRKLNRREKLKLLAELYQKHPPSLVFKNIIWEIKVYFPNRFCVLIVNAQRVIMDFNFCLEGIDPESAWQEHKFFWIYTSFFLCLHMDVRI